MNTISDDKAYVVLINQEEQYSLWASKLAIPPGWTETECRGDKTKCLDYIDTHWTDMRPLSVRKLQNS